MHSRWRGLHKFVQILITCVIRAWFDSKLCKNNLKWTSPDICDVFVKQSHWDYRFSCKFVESTPAQVHAVIFKHNVDITNIKDNT